MSYSKNIFCGILVLCYGHLLQAQNNTGGKISAFTIKGNVGASANFYNSNEAFYSRPSYAWNVNGNFVAKVDQVTLPFSFIANQYGNSNQSVYFQAGISPTYKWAKVHLGYRYIPFSPFTFEGQSFRGAGVELNPKLFHFAAFYGKLNKAVNEDTSRDHSALPSFSRTGYGVKLGYGNIKNFFNLIYFHAKDDSSSASFINDSSRNNSIRPQENAVLGASFKLTMLKKVAWTGDMAISGLITDLSPGKKNLDSSNTGLKRLINNFLPNNMGILAGYAGQSSLSYYSAKYNGSLSYRRVQPNFKSMGTAYLLNDIELITLNNNYSADKGKLNISANLSQQHNDLDKDLSSELRTQVGNFNVNTILTPRLSVNINYSGYNLTQKNENSQLPDSVRLNDTLLLKQWISQLNISPSYYIANSNKLHLISGNVSLQSLKDKNPATASRSNSSNLSASVGYTITLIKKFLSFSLNYLYSRYKQESNSYNSNGVTVGSSAQLLKSKNLNIQGNIGYYSNKFSNLSTQQNISYSANVGYNARHHTFNLFANYIYSPPNNEIIDAVNKTFPYAVANKNFAGGISYNYTF